MNSEEIIKKLKQFSEKFPYPAAHRMLAEMVISFLQIRKLPNYQMSVPGIVGNLRHFVCKEVLRSGGSENRAAMDMFEWTNISFCLGDLSDEAAEEITQACYAMLPEKDDTLGKFLSQKLGLDGMRPSDADHFYRERDKFAIGVARSLSGICEEKLQFRPDEFISDGKWMELIEEYYRSRGYRTEKPELFSGALSAEKGDRFLTIAMSNYGDMVLISVLPG